MPALTSGLTRLTVRAPRRRMDLAVPHQVPLAELLPEMVRQAGEAGPAPATVAAGRPGATVPTVANWPASGGWMLRRGDGAGLVEDQALASQGVREGDVLYLVPRQLHWPEPVYDDVVEEIAERVRSRGRRWDAQVTRVFALTTAGLVLLTGLAVLAGAARLVPSVAGLAAAGVAAALVVVGGLLSRALGDGIAAAAAGGLSLPYAGAAGALLATATPPDLVGAVPPVLLARPEQLLVGGSAVLLAAVVNTVVVGTGVRVFTAGLVVGLFIAAGGGLGLVLSPAGAAAILAVTVVAAIGLAPVAAVRLGRLPLPAVSATPEEIAAAPRPDPAAVSAAVTRADEILAGLVAGVSGVAFGCVAVLAAGADLAGWLLAGLTCTALLLRARIYPTVAVRLPLLCGGALGLALTALASAWSAGAPVRVLAVALAGLAVIGLLTVAATTRRSATLRSPYLGRLADLADVATVVALLPAACAVLDLYRWAGALTT
ncbi:MAG TPA: type VII secretion integral membrane protein EccD [Micromonosporaceae bacterium]